MSELPPLELSPGLLPAGMVTMETKRTMLKTTAMTRTMLKTTATTRRTAKMVMMLRTVS